MNEVRHTRVLKAARPRTGRVLDRLAAGVPGGGFSGAPGGSGGQGGSGVTDHAALTGVVLSESYLATDAAIHLTPVMLDNIKAGLAAGAKITYANGYLLYAGEKIKAGRADHAILADTATHAATADVATDIAPTSPVYTRFLRKDVADRAAAEITFEKGINVTGGAKTDTLNVSSHASVNQLNVVNNTATLNLAVRELAETYNLSVTHVATILSTIVKDYVSSETFVSGFAGEGMRLYKAVTGDWNLEIDNLTVRKLFSVFELVVQRLVHQGGMVIRSAAGGRLKKVTDGGTYWRCEHDSTDDFQPDDQILCQFFTGTKIKRYWRRVSNAGPGYFNLSKADCEPESGTPEAGDDVAVLGNRTNPARQKAQIDCAAGDFAPYRDDYDGINGYTLAGKLVTRSGNLTGISDAVFGALSGVGFYGTNVYLKGSFILRSGKKVEEAIRDVETSLGTRITETETNFEIREGQISTKVSEATTAAGNAKKSETAAAGSATTAEQKAAATKTAAVAAAACATAAGQSASAAQAAAATAETVLEDVTKKESSITQTAGEIATKVTEVNKKVTEANTAATNAKTSETAASGSATTAGQKATAAAGSATTATNNANAAASSATAAAGSAAAAKTSADTAAAKLVIITEKESSITQTAGEIATKVTEATRKATEAATSASNAAGSATAAAGSATTAGQKATAAAGSATTAEQKAAAAKTAADTAAAKLVAITEKESSITQTANEISAKVTRAETAAGRAETAEANINLRADGIVLQASSSAAAKAISDLQVGGRNYFLNSAVERTGANEYVGVNILALAKAHQGETFTFSADVKLAVAGNVSFYANGKYEIGTSKVFTLEANKFTRLSITGTFNYNANGTGGETCQLSWFGTYGTGRIPTVKNIKIEKGNKATDWTPAPEDVENKISDHETRLSRAELKITDSAIKSVVSGDIVLAQQNAQSYADGKVNDLQIGTKNLLLNAKPAAPWTGGPTKYAVTGFSNRQSELMQIGETYTIVFNGRSTAPTGMGLWQSASHFVRAWKAETDTTFTHTFVCTLANSYVAFYHVPSGGAGESVLNWAMLFKGSKAPSVWQPAPEDLETAAADAQNAANTANSNAQAAQNSANAAQNSANVANSNAIVAQNAAVVAKAVADTAQATANTASTNAQNANNLLSDIASDSKLTAQEKQATKKEWDVIAAEYSKNIAAAGQFAIATTAYTTAYNALNTYVTPLLVNLAVTSNITGSDFRTKFKTYYDARTDLLNAISAKAKTLADTAQSAANTAKATADTAQSTANAAQNSANAAQANVDRGKLYIRGAGTNNWHTAEIVLHNDGINRIEPTHMGIALLAIRRSDLAIFATEYYMVFNNDSECNRLASKLNGLPSNYIICLASYDCIRINGALSAAIARCGGSIGPTNGDIRLPYALVGIPGIGLGKGIEVYTGSGETDPPAEIVTKIDNGMFTGANTAIAYARSIVEQTKNSLRLAVEASTGACLYKDVDFRIGLNGIRTYNIGSSGIGGVVIEWITRTVDCPTTSPYMLRLTRPAAAQTLPSLGGFTFTTMSRANAVFEARIKAKIPEGYTLNFAGNATGDNPKAEWLTSNAGTGKWRDYVHQLKCGADGTFSTTNFFYIDGPAPATDFIWYVASATVYDVHAREDLISQINMAPGSLQIDAAKINISGAVTFSAFDSALQNKINAKAESSAVSGLQSQVTSHSDEIRSVWGELAKKENTTDIVERIVDSRDTLARGLGYASYAAMATAAANGKTLINGGYIRTELIDTTTLVVRDGAAIGNLQISGGGLSGDKMTLNQQELTFVDTANNNNIVASIGSNAAPGMLGIPVPIWINNQCNTAGANYGIALFVSNGLRNFGLISNAACLAPAFVSRKYQTIYLNGTGYTVDFSQCTNFVVYTNNTTRSLTLPTLDAVKQMFGYTNSVSLPDDFGVRLFFAYKFDAGGQVNFTGLTDNNGNIGSASLTKGDTLELFAYKASSKLVYQITMYKQ